MRRILQLPLTSRSTGRSFSRNLDNSARGGIDEGFEAIAFGDPFSTTIRFVADPGLPGHGQGQDTGTSGAERHASFRSTLNERHHTHKIRVTDDSE